MAKTSRTNPHPAPSTPPPAGGRGRRGAATTGAGGTPSYVWVTLGPHSSTSHQAELLEIRNDGYLVKWTISRKKELISLESVLEQELPSRHPRGGGGGRPNPRRRRRSSSGGFSTNSSNGNGSAGEEGDEPGLAPPQTPLLVESGSSSTTKEGRRLQQGEDEEEEEEEEEDSEEEEESESEEEEDQEDEEEEDQEEEEEEEEEDDDDEDVEVVKRGPGRPPKNKKQKTSSSSSSSKNNESTRTTWKKQKRTSDGKFSSLKNSTTTTKRKPGRPRKNPLPENKNAVVAAAPTTTKPKKISTINDNKHLFIEAIPEEHKQFVHLFKLHRIVRKATEARVGQFLQEQLLLQQQQRQRSLQDEELEHSQNSDDDDGTNGFNVEAAGSLVSEFFLFCFERQCCWQRRNNEDNPLWSLSPILQHYNFCNVYRELDRGTCYVRSQFAEHYIQLSRKWNEEATMNLLVGGGAATKKGGGSSGSKAGGGGGGVGNGVGGPPGSHHHYNTKRKHYGNNNQNSGGGGGSGSSSRNNNNNKRIRRRDWIQKLLWTSYVFRQVNQMESFLNYGKKGMIPNPTDLEDFLDYVRAAQEQEERNPKKRRKKKKKKNDDYDDDDDEELDDDEDDEEDDDEFNDESLAAIETEQAQQQQQEQQGFFATTYPTPTFEEYQFHLQQLNQANGWLLKSIAGRLAQCRTIQACWEQIGQRLPGMRDYPDIAWQVLCDLMESGCLLVHPHKLDSIDWIYLSPPQQKILASCWKDRRVDDARSLSLLKLLTEQQDEVFETIGVEFPAWDGRPLAIKDLAHCLSQYMNYLKIQADIKRGLIEAGQQRKKGKNRQHRLLVSKSYLDVSKRCRFCDKQTDDGLFCDACLCFYCKGCEEESCAQSPDCWICNPCKDLDNLQFVD